MLIGSIDLPIKEYKPEYKHCHYISKIDVSNNHEFLIFYDEINSLFFTVSTHGGIQ